MNKAQERDAIGEWFYDEHRLERYSIHREHLPMWHELDTEAQMEWTHRAVRLQQWLTMRRSLARKAS